MNVSINEPDCSIIAPNGKSINVVTDNGSSDAKTCQVSCKVNTKIGVVCLENTPGK